MFYKIAYLKLALRTDVLIELALSQMIITTSDDLLKTFDRTRYTGAPWNPHLARFCGPNKVCCCNSGLSLWHRNKTLSLLGSHIRFSGSMNIDYWLWLQLTTSDANTQKEVSSTRASVPHVRIAKYFAVEAVYPGGYTPFGVHKPWGRQKNTSEHVMGQFFKVARYGSPLVSTWPELLDRCPEVRLLADYASHAAQTKDSNKAITPSRKQARAFLEMLQSPNKVHRT